MPEVPNKFTSWISSSIRVFGSLSKVNKHSPVHKDKVRYFKEVALCREVLKTTTHFIVLDTQIHSLPFTTSYLKSLTSVRRYIELIKLKFGYVK